MCTSATSTLPLSAQICVLRSLDVNFVASFGRSTTKESDVMYRKPGGFALVILRCCINAGRTARCSLQVALHTAISQLPVIDGWSDAGAQASIAPSFTTNCHVMMGDFIN
jgi:hypothetical protein